MTSPAPTKSRVACLGPSGTHSHAACLRFYGADAAAILCDGFREVLQTLESPGARRATAAILPVENSIEGPVTQSLDLLAEHDRLVVTESFCLKISHCLLAPRTCRLEDIEVVFSHPQALAQTRRWLEAHLPQARIEAAISTAQAAHLASATPKAAAVAGRQAGRLHGLRALARDIQDQASNTTRFVEVRPRKRQDESQRTTTDMEQRALLHVILPNRPGALLHALQPFQTAGLNLSFIQSRPLPGRPWEYGFFIEVQVSGREREFVAVIDFLRAFMERVHLLGCYRFHRRPLT